MRTNITHVKSISWLPKDPLNLEEGPITGEKVYAVKSWGAKSDKGKLAAMRELASTYGHDPRMRWFTVNSVLRPAGVDFRDYPRVAAALLAWVQTRIYYTNEPGEQIQAPWWTLKYKTGDCDDMAVLLAAMAESVRLPWRFVLAGRDRKGRSVRMHEGGKYVRAQFHHIYLDLGWPPFKPTTWAAAEPTIKGAPLGFDVVQQEAQLPEMMGAHAGRPQPQRATGTSAPMRRVGARMAGYGAADGVDGRTSGVAYQFPQITPPVWKEIGLGVLQGVVTALVIEYVLRRRK